jgi:hypothetical protein
VAASSAAPGAMRMSSGPSRWKLKPRSAESTCGRQKRSLQKQQGWR